MESVTTTAPPREQAITPGANARQRAASDLGALDTGVPRSSPLRTFLLLRYALIVATAYLLLVEADLRLPPSACIALVVAAFASNVALTALPPQRLRNPYFGSAVMVADTLWITAALLLSRRFGAEFFFVYFLVLLIAAIGETLWLIGVATAAVCGTYVYVLAAQGGPWTVWSSPSLVRIPFLLAAAAFYGYLIDRTRIERRRAEEADRIKSEFLGTISHELRTPLTVILGYIDLLLDDEFGAISSEQRAVLGKVQAAGGNLHRYLTRLLDVSRLVNRLQSGREAVTCGDFALDSVFAELRYDLADPYGARVQWPALHDLPPLFTDRGKLVTILRNLIDNAVKYGQDAPVTISVRWEPSDDTLSVTVADRGIGIAKNDLPYIFDPFRRTADAIQTSAPGVGLGLYIVKQFAELLHGTLSIDSAHGVGSSFTLRIPRRLDPQARRARA